MATEEHLIDARDVPAALGFLTRLPVRVDGNWAAARGARNAWAYPLAGLVIGALATAVAALLASITSPAIAAGFALAAAVIVTGALHEDGLADACDGLWGGWTRERRLEIMKDSRIGAYGVIGLVLSLLIRWLGLSALIGAGLWWAIVAIPAASRAAMLPLMALPHARSDGVSATVGHPPRNAIYLGVALGAVALVPLGYAALALILWIALSTVACALIARAKISGQTGDILGATQQIAEIAGLTAATALLI